MMNVKVDAMRRAGSILGEVLGELAEAIHSGITELEIDSLAEKLILKKGGLPGFKKVPGYHHAICISVNNVVVHGIPTQRTISEGDIVGIDCGVYLDGYHTDMAETIRVSTKNEQLKTNNSNKEIEKFLEAGKNAMFAGISKATAGNHIGDISKAIQDIIEGAGYSVVRSLIGHGVGKKLHEEPEIPGYLTGSIGKTPNISVGQTLAIEVIYNMGRPDVVYGSDDDWTIYTEDGSLSGLFERTILVTDKGPEFITKLKSDKL